MYFDSHSQSLTIGALSGVLAAFLPAILARKVPLAYYCEFTGAPLGKGFIARLQLITR